MDLLDELAQTINFRDVGGMRTGNGETVAFGRLFRAGLLTHLDPEMRAAIETELGVKTVVDVRRAVEATKDAPADFRIARVHAVPITPDGARPIVDPEDTIESVAEWYWQLITIDGAAVARIIEILAEEGDVPAVVHCHAGKDRTGVIIALVLSVLGVPRETIVADYAASGRNESDPFFQTLPPKFSEAHPEIMDHFLARIDGAYGSVEGYLESVGLTEATFDSLRRRYLIPADGPVTR